MYTPDPWEGVQHNRITDAQLFCVKVKKDRSDMNKVRNLQWQVYRTA